MTQQIINVGAAVNDGTGESLRSAFQAVNNNFSNVWAHGPVDSQVVISNNVISTNVTNQTLVLRPDGTGVITVASSVVPSIDSVYDLGAANAQYDSVFARYYYGDASNMTGLPQPTNLEAVNTDILPIATRAFDIGSQTQQWAKIYAGGIVAGNTSVITIDVGNLHIPGGNNGYVLQTDGAGNLSWTAQTGGGGNGTPGGANTQIQFNDAGTFGGQSNFTFNKVSGQMTVPGNLVPAGNVTQSLGSPTQQWKDLWVSNNTIYINSVPLTLSSSNVLSIDGNPIVTVAPGNVSNIGNFAFNENSLQNPNGVGLNNGSLVNGWTAQLALPANGNTGAISLQNTYGNIVLGSGSNAVVTAQWTFANTGLLSSTGNIAANTITLSGQAVLANSLGAVGELGFDFAGPAVNAYTGKSVNIRSNDQAHTWRFGTAGNLTLPDGSVIDQGGLYGNGAGVVGNSTGDIQVYAQNSGVGIQTFDGNNYYTWFLDRNGNLTLPTNSASINYANGAPYGGGATTDRLVNGNLAVVLDSSGTLNTPLLLPKSFTATCSSSVYVPTVSQPTLTLTGDPWYFAVAFVVNQSGDVETQITNNTPWAENPGYADDMEFAFTEAEHGIPGYTFTLTMFSIQNPGPMMWTTNLSASVPPTYPSTIASPGPVQVTANASSWVFGTDGLTTLPDGTVMGTVEGANTFGFYNNNANVEYLLETSGNSWSFNGATGNITLPRGSTIGEVPSPIPGNYALSLGGTGMIDPDQQLLVYPTFIDANHLHLTSGNLYNTELFLGNDDLYVKLSNTGNIVINANDSTGNTAQWTFDATGNLTVPGSTARIQTQNTGWAFTGSITSITYNTPVVIVLAENVFPDPVTGRVTISGVNPPVQVNGTWYYQAVETNAFALYSDANLTQPVAPTDWPGYVDGGFAVALGQLDMNLLAGSLGVTTGQNGTNYNWNFHKDGTTVFPTLDVNLHNGGVQAAQTLQFGDPSQQAVITGPTPPAGQNAQRLIIQGQNGGDGEGGDVYLWSGDANVNGGDIKIYAGDADNGASPGYGGYINIDGGSGFDTGGQVSLSGGYSQGGSGGPVYISAGQGTTGGDVTINGGGASVNTGGAVNITGGYGQSAGGTVVITGGGSGIGLPGYGNVAVQAGASGWTFDNTGTLTVPGEGIIQSLNDTVVLQSKNTGSGNIVTARLGTNGGLYFEGTEYPNGWLSLTNNAGNANITAASGTSGGGGKNINITAGSADQSDYYNTSGGDVNIYSGIGAFNDGGGGGPGGNINIVAGDSADPAGHAGNVNISAGANDWVFDYAGNLTLPSNSFTVNYANGTPVNLGGNYGDSNVASFLAAYGSNTVSTTGNITAGNFIGSGSNVDIVAGAYDWTFANDGNLTLPGNTFAVNYANGSPVNINGTPVGSNTYVQFNDGGVFGGTNALTFNKADGNLNVNGGFVNAAAVVTTGRIQVGTSLSVTGNATIGNISTSAVSATGNITGNTAGFTIGYRDVPQVTFSANATAAITDAGKHYYSTTAGNLALTLPDNSSVAFPTGATLTLVVNAAGNILVNQGTGVSLYMAGSSTTGNRVVGAYGLASVMKVAANTWVISGTGVY